MFQQRTQAEKEEIQRRYGSFIAYLESKERIAEIAKDIIEISKSFNIDAQIVGRVEASDNKKLTIVSEYGTFEY